MACVRQRNIACARHSQHYMFVFHFSSDCGRRRRRRRHRRSIVCPPIKLDLVILQSATGEHGHACNATASHTNERDRNQESAHVRPRSRVRAYTSLLKIIIKLNKWMEKCTCFRSLIFVSHFVGWARLPPTEKKLTDLFLGFFFIFFRTQEHRLHTNTSQYIGTGYGWVGSYIRYAHLPSQIMPPVPIDPVLECTHLYRVRMMFNLFVSLRFGILVLSSAGDAYSTLAPNERHWIYTMKIELNIFSNNKKHTTKSPFHSKQTRISHSKPISDSRDTIHSPPNETRRRREKSH